MASACSVKVTVLPFLSFLVYTCGVYPFFNCLTPSQLSLKLRLSLTLLAVCWSLSFLAAFLICFRSVLSCSFVAWLAVSVAFSCCLVC